VTDSDLEIEVRLRDSRVSDVSSVNAGDEGKKVLLVSDCRLEVHLIVRVVHHQMILQAWSSG
jgi:hypothetical protein